MEMESSSRSPDSSCPDYYPYEASLGHANRDQSSSSADSFISSSTGNRVSSSLGVHFQSHLENNRSSRIPEDLSRNQSYQNNGKSVINFAVGRNDDRFRSTPESLSRGQSNHNSRESVSNFPTVGSEWHRSSSITDNLGSLLSSTNYQSSSLSSGIDNFYKTTVEQVGTSNNPPYSEPEMPYFSSSTSVLAAKTTPGIVPLPKKEHSNVSSSVSNKSTSLSVPPSKTNYVNSAIQQKTNVLGDQIIPKNSRIPKSFPQINSQRHDTLWSSNHVPQHQSSSYDLDPPPEKSVQSSYVEKSLKRKSSPVLNNSDYLLSAPSSSSNYVDKEQSISNESKKIKVHSSTPYVELDNIDDDDIQIIMPEKGHSSASGSSLSTASYRKPSVILPGGSLNSSKPIKSERGHNQLLNSQISPQTTQDRSSTIHNPLSPEELEQMLDSVWSDLDEIASSTNNTTATGSTPGAESEESSSSSIISIHEVIKDTNSFEMSKPHTPVLEEVPSDIPALITLDSSPKNSELQELKAAKQEAENVKEDFKRLIEDELICNICTEVLIKPITLGCSHTFCKFCISEWKEKKRQCPMCRASIETETPCLFLDNFISKAVEQLDPASVEKRLEIIKSREEQQKKKIYKPPVQRHQPPTLTLPFHSYSSIVLNSVRQPPNSVSQLSNFWNQLERTSNLVQRGSIIHEQSSNIFQQALSIPHQSSNIPQLSSSLTQLSSGLTQLSSSLSQRSNIPQQSSSIPQQSSSIPQRSSSIPQRSSNIPQRSSNIPQQFSNVGHLPSPYNGHTNGYFYWK